MKKTLLVLTFLIIILVGVVVWKFIFPKKDTDQVPKPQGLTVSRHTDNFNQSVMAAMNSYYNLTETFVKWDTATISSSLAGFKMNVDSIRIQEMEKDTAIYPTVQSQWEMIKSEIVGMQADTSLYEKREALNMLSQQLFDLLRIIRYDAAKVYYQECPMALNNYESSAFWLSTSGQLNDRRNPYLGLYDPKYGKSMLKCGSTRDSINFVESNKGN